MADAYKTMRRLKSPELKTVRCTDPECRRHVETATPHRKVQNSKSGDRAL